MTESIGRNLAAERRQILPSCFTEVAENLNFCPISAFVTSICCESDNSQMAAKRRPVILSMTSSSAYIFVVILVGIVLSSLNCKVAPK